MSMVMRIVMIAAAAGLCCGREAAAQGALTPPGAPAPVMKTLNQIEPRTPISSLPYHISSSGSYYLTGNLTGAPVGLGIEISADNVTLDLMGFTLQGVFGSLHGIHIPSARSGIIIRNGTIRDWGRRGINASLTDRSTFSNLLISVNGFGAADSEAVRVGNDCLFTDCAATFNADIGFFVLEGCSFINCTASDNGDDGFSTGGSGTMRNCIAGGNLGYGFLTLDRASFSGCVAELNWYGFNAGEGSVLSGCVAASNTGNGIAANFGSSLINCSAIFNSAIGIEVQGPGTVADCSSYWNLGDGIVGGSAVTVSNCLSHTNSGDGIRLGAGSSAVHCNSGVNMGDGIEASNDAHLLANNCDSNGVTGGDGAGIYVTGSDNRIDGNNVTDNDRGIDTDAGGNLIIRNSASGNTTNYDITGTQTIGPIITATGTIASTSPWANFSY